MNNILHNFGPAATRFTFKNLTTKFAANSTQPTSHVRGSGSNTSTRFAHRKLAARFIETSRAKIKLPTRRHCQISIQCGVAEVPVPSSPSHRERDTIAQIPGTASTKADVATKPKSATPCSQIRNFSASLTILTTHSLHATPARTQSSYNSSHVLTKIKVSTPRHTPTTRPTLAAFILAGIIVAYKGNELPDLPRSNSSAAFLELVMGSEEEEQTT